MRGKIPTIGEKLIPYMTVGQLMEKLSTFDPSLIVMEEYYDSEYGKDIQSVGSPELRTVKVGLIELLGGIHSLVFDPHSHVNIIESRIVEVVVI